MSEDAATTVLQSLKNRDDKEILSHAMSQIHEIWQTENLHSKQERRHLGPVAGGSIILKPRTWAGAALTNIAYGTYKRHRRLGLLEPDFPYLRFSAPIEKVDTKSPSNEIPILPLREAEKPPQLGPKP